MQAPCARCASPALRGGTAVPIIVRVPTPPVIAVVGAGFCGVVSAIELLRAGLPGGTRLLLIERPGHGIGGQAYDVASQRVLLNVRAERMSAFAESPGDFVNYLAAAHPGESAASFAPRHYYGRYLATRLDMAAFREGSRTVLEPTAAEVIDVKRRSDSRFEIIADAGVRRLALIADAVLLATGASVPLPPRWLEPWMLEEGRYVDAWSRSAATAGALETLVAIGSGLSFVDLVIELRAGGFRGRIVAISRHGQLPRPEGRAIPLPEPDDLPAEIASLRPPTARRLMRALVSHAGVLAERGRDYRSMLAALRPHSRRLWAGLDPDERGRFLRHARALWDVHRHRMPEVAARVIAAELEAGTLEVLAGRVRSVGRSARGLTLAVEWRGRSGTQPLEAGRIVNCTGAPAGAPLGAPWPALLERGSAQRDALGLGVLTDPNGRLIDAGNRPLPGLFYAGPLWRAQDWEITAVPELRARLPEVTAALAAGVVRAGVLA